MIGLALHAGLLPAPDPVRSAGRSAPREHTRSSVDDDAPTTRGSHGTGAVRLFTPLSKGNSDV
jgi:hypothetical protein